MSDDKIATTASSPIILRSSLELEDMQPMLPLQQEKEKRQQDDDMIQHWKQYFLSILLQSWTLFKLHLEHYPRTFVVAACCLIVLLLFMMIVRLSSPAREPLHKVYHDYSELDTIYQLKVAQIHHWCLLGGNEQCQCQDPSDAAPRRPKAVPNWIEAHKRNKKQAAAAAEQYDVVFYGDDTVEAWTGRTVGELDPKLRSIHRLWNQSFTKQEKDGGKIQGLALGVTGDVTSSLLYRLKQGEIPSGLRSKVWWILIGINDLVADGCSEEAVILGILRVAEEVALQKKDAVIVIQGLLPRTFFQDGSLTSTSGRHHTDTDQDHSYSLWPSIEVINQELERFCHKHEHFVYFDATELLVGRISNEHFTSASKTIIADLMPDYAHLSATGYRVMNKAILQELDRIILQHDEQNRFAEPDDEPVTP